MFLPAALLVASSPGANNLLALRNGHRAGARAAIAALGGRVVGFAIMLALSIAGLVSILAASQVAFEAIKWASVAYLLYLGARSLLDSRSAAPQEDLDRDPRGRLALARQELVVVLANPKALLLFTAFLPQFIDPSAPAAGQLLVFGPLYMAMEVMAACGWAAVGSRIRAAGLSARARRRVERVTGGVFIGLAGWLATSQRQAT